MFFRSIDLLHWSQTDYWIWYRWCWKKNSTNNGLLLFIRWYLVIILLIINNWFSIFFNLEISNIKYIEVVVKIIFEFDRIIFLYLLYVLVFRMNNNIQNSLSKSMIHSNRDIHSLSMDQWFSATMKKLQMWSCFFFSQKTTALE